MRISDWSSDVCSSDLGPSSRIRITVERSLRAQASGSSATCCIAFQPSPAATRQDMPCGVVTMIDQVLPLPVVSTSTRPPLCVTPRAIGRSEEHTSELQSLMRISYAVFCLKKQNSSTHTQPHIPQDSSINTAYH